MATDSEFSQIVRLLNGVKTAGAARQAAGAALRSASAAFKLAETLPRERRDSNKRALEAARVNLQQWYTRIEKVSAAAPFDNEWARGRPLVLKVYSEIAGIEGEANHKPATSNLDILAQSLREAPKVFAQAVGSVAKEAGAVAGSAAGGIFAGLGISGTLTLVVVVALVVVFLRRGTLIGRLLG